MNNDTKIKTTLVLSEEELDILRRACLYYKEDIIERARTFLNLKKHSDSGKDNECAEISNSCDKLLKSYQKQHDDLCKVLKKLYSSGDNDESTEI